MHGRSIFTPVITFFDRFPHSTTRWGWRFSLAMITGLFAGLAAVLLEMGIESGSEHLVGRFADLGGPEVLRFNWAILLLPAIGGLVAGLMVHLFCPRSTEHGINLMTRVFHHNMGQLEFKGPAIKAAGSALVISAGGSAGPEGPIGALGAAIGSTLGRWFPVTPQDRRISRM